MRNINYNLNLAPLKIESVCVGNLIENRIFDMVIYGDINQKVKE